MRLQPVKYKLDTPSLQVIRNKKRIEKRKEKLKTNKMSLKNTMRRPLI